MNDRLVRRRPPFVVVGWAAVLAITVGLGVLGQGGEAVVVPPVATPVASVAGPAATGAAALPGRPPKRPMATRPPIGEDGVMGGLVFGTAWTWLRQPTSER